MMGKLPEPLTLMLMHWSKAKLFKLESFLVKQIQAVEQADFIARFLRFGFVLPPVCVICWAVGWINGKIW
jgi:hypothetical protein